MTFELQHTDNASDARTGIITTDHGQIKTPIFMLRSYWATPITCICAPDWTFSGVLADCISSTRGTAPS